MNSSAGLRLIARAKTAIPSEVASLKLCKASAIRDRLPEIIPPITWAKVKTIFIAIAKNKLVSLSDLL